MNDLGVKPDILDLENLASTAIEVSNLYGFLATVFRAEVSEEFLQQVRTPEIRAVLQGEGTDIGDRVFDGPADKVLEELAVEYTALFLGPGGHVSPHESVYAQGGTGGLWGQETAAVRRFIEALGFAYDENYRGIPDHVSVELELLAELARRESLAWESGDTEAAANCLEFEQEFMHDHLATWVPQFCEQVEAEAGLPFYGQIAQLTAGFLQSEQEEIDQRLAVARG